MSTYHYLTSGDGYVESGSLDEIKRDAELAAIGEGVQVQVLDDRRNVVHVAGRDLPSEAVRDQIHEALGDLSPYWLD